MGYFEKKYAWLFLVLGAVCWSMAGVFVKSTSWNPVSIATVRGTFSFLVFLSFRLILKPGYILQERYITGTLRAEGETDLTYIGWDGLFDRKVLIQEFFPRF